MTGSNNRATRLFDAHCHLSFAPKVAQQELIDQFKKAGNGAFSTTVSPRDYRNAQVRVRELGIESIPRESTPQKPVFRKHAQRPFLYLGCGLHPWWITDGRCETEEIEQAIQLVEETLFVGEVGLDFGSRNLSNSVYPTTDETKTIQVRSFMGMLDHAALRVDRGAHADDGASFTHISHADHSTSRTHISHADCIVRPEQADRRPVVSIHAVQSLDLVLDIVQERPLCPILHWFSGTSDQLQRAKELGCYFSLGLQSFLTKKGRAYAQAIPLNRLFIETDLPEEAAQSRKPREVSQDYLSSLEQAYERLADLRGLALEETRDALWENKRRVFGE